VRRISSSARGTIPRAHVASLTHFQVSLPSLGARSYAASANALARALASTVRLPNLEEERQGIYRVTPPAGGQRRMGTIALVLAWA
jgi:hypothetical protein